MVTNETPQEQLDHVDKQIGVYRTLFDDISDDRCEAIADIGAMAILFDMGEKTFHRVTRSYIESGAQMGERMKRMEEYIERMLNTPPSERKDFDDEGRALLL